MSVNVSAQNAFVKTPARFGFDTLWLRQVQKTNVVFGVRTCNDAILALSEEMEKVSNSYEVVIGGYGNKRSDIRSNVQSDAVARMDTPDIVSCNETRFFWVSWDGGLIEVGLGLRVGQRRFLFWKDLSPRNVTAVGFTGWDKENDWEFTHNDGMSSTSLRFAFNSFKLYKLICYAL